MTETLVIIKGYKLPGESVWVTADDMYEVYSKINICIDGGHSAEMIITNITDEGLFVESLQ
tara:strand:+ start:430 stop:612 length:183 start_codon:yes stop_codon:yes gene_type:complete